MEIEPEVDDSFDRMVNESYIRNGTPEQVVEAFQTWRKRLTSQNPYLASIAPRVLKTMLSTVHAMVDSGEIADPRLQETFQDIMSDYIQSNIALIRNAGYRSDEEQEDGLEDLFSSLSRLRPDSEAIMILHEQCVPPLLVWLPLIFLLESSRQRWSLQSDVATNCCR